MAKKIPEIDDSEAGGPYNGAPVDPRPEEPRAWINEVAFKIPGTDIGVTRLVVAAVISMGIFVAIV